MITPHRRMELAASDFATAWRDFFESDPSGSRPLITDALRSVESELSTDQRLELLEWLLTEEVRQRKNHGEQPLPSEYYDHFPHLSEHRRIVDAVVNNTPNLVRGTDYCGATVPEESESSR